MLLKSCPVALHSEILTVISAPSPDGTPIAMFTLSVSLPTLNESAIPVVGAASSAS